MLYESDYVKIRTSVPASAADAVRLAMGNAGAGRQGNYSHCSTSYQTVGRFTPLVGAHPAIGSVGESETVNEETIEMICHKDCLKAVIQALRAAHPYEEPAIDIHTRLELQ